MARNKHEHVPAGKGGLSVAVSNGNIEKSLRKFKKMVMNDGILTECRERELYRKPSEIKRQRKRDAIRRRKKQEQLAKLAD